jgi:solute:Na+ symporter, SSS family
VHLPYLLGVMVFIGVLGASMSTANGAMLVISVVLARSVFQRWSKREYDDSFMLMLSRVMALPTAIGGALIAYLRPEPGILLVIAFDIVFAGCVAPLFFGVYWKKANSTAAISAILCGTLSRLVAHFVTPAQWAGLDTLIPPMISTAVFFVVCNLTWKTEPSRHHVLDGAQEPELA